MKYGFKNITSPSPYQVFQRSSKDIADIEVAGEFRGDKDAIVEFRVGGSDWQAVKIKGEGFSGVAKSVPVGGPYSLDLKISGKSGHSSTKRIPGLLVGDLWMLGGQSNMDGYGKLVDLEMPSSLVNAFYYTETWAVAKDPLCRLCDAIDPAHCAATDPVERAKASQSDRDFRVSGAGLGVRFGKDLAKATGVPVGLIICSHGGTSMAQWNPDTKFEGCKSMYGSMLRRVNVAGGKVAGVLWYQGESDSGSEETRKVYNEAMHKMIESFRADIGTKDMPFIYVQLGPFFADDMATRDGWNDIQNQQLAIESEIKNTAVIPAIDAGLSDAIHLDAPSLRKIGALMALQARKIKFDEKNILSGPRPADFEFIDAARTKLRIKFTGVNGSLRPTSDIRGFSIEADGTPIAIRKRVRESVNSIVLTFAESVPKGANLWYGRGVSPVCNLSDAKGFPTPVFGPVKL